MAENKKSFLLYCDLIHTVSKMPDDKAGQLLKHVLEYVNDLNPQTNDLIIQLTFEPIKQQLKRDLLKYKAISEERSEIGKLGGIKSGEARRTKMKQNEANASKLKQNEQDTDTDTVIDTDKDKVKDKVKDIFTPPQIESVIAYFQEKGYTAEAAKRAFEFYDVNQWKDSKGNKVLNWKQKMISVWFKDEHKVKQAYKAKML